jgi:DeoR/GlpR family transcriptional regulator of sugar metabolism
MDRQFERKKYDERDAKMAVALEVYERFIRNNKNPRVFLDAGTSAAAVAKVLHFMVEEDKKAEETENVKKIPQRRVFTHNLEVWEQLKKLPDIDLYLAGGRYNSQLNAILEGELFEKFLELGCNIAVIAVSGVDPLGLWCSNIQDEAIIKKHLANAPVVTRLIIADFSKIGVNDVKNFFPLDKKKSNSEKSNSAKTYLITNDVENENQELWGKDTHHRDAYEETRRKFIQEFGTERDRERLKNMGSERDQNQRTIPKRGRKSDAKASPVQDQGFDRWIEVSVRKWKREVPDLFNTPD